MVAMELTSPDLSPGSSENQIEGKTCKPALDEGVCSGRLEKHLQGNPLLLI